MAEVCSILWEVYPVDGSGAEQGAFSVSGVEHAYGLERIFPLDRRRESGEE